uniref:DNA polymerase n=1 Tax=Daedaleopsis nitida TaxID=1140402 RepID=UPI0030E3A69D
MRHNKVLKQVGKWIGIYTSLECNKAIELGYKWNIIEGIKFNSKYIFKDYIENLYQIKNSNSEDSPIYLIITYLLNNLYSEFTINHNIFKHTIITKDKLDGFYFR